MLSLLLTPSSNVRLETAELAAVNFFAASFLDSATVSAAAAAMSVTLQKNEISPWPCAHVRHRYQQEDNCLGKKGNQELFFVACFWHSDVMRIAGVEGTQQQEGSWMPVWLKSRLPGDCQQSRMLSPSCACKTLTELPAETLGGTKEPATDELDLDSKLLVHSGLP